MRLSFGPRGVAQIDDCRIIYRNFSGIGSPYNREGDRNFAVIIPDAETADALVREGWSVKVKPPREEGDEPFRYMAVKVKFNDFGPKIYLQSGSARRELNPDTVSCLDRIEIESVNMDLRPYDWERNGETGRSAYLQGMWVTQRLDRFAERYAEEMGEAALE